MRVLVCGGRDYTDRDKLFDYLNDLEVIQWRIADPIEIIIHGDARGADKLAGEWATSLSIKCETYPADWEQHGKSAGPIRNKQMLDEGKPDIVIAFPGGKGTANMIKQATDAGITVHQV